MDEFPRRTFTAMLAASMGTVSGCTFVPQGPTASATSDDGDVSVVTTRKELETAFADLSPGDTVRIDDENAPYRTTQWLDVDADGVTVVGPGVRNLIQPADGANVGGIRIGANDACRDVDVRGVGYRGNPDGQGNRAERLHGIDVRNATNVTLERNVIRRTYPIRHGDGGSGISVARKSSNVRIANNEIHQFGDRGVQLGGRRLVVFGNVVTNGLDRPVACDLWYPDEKNRTAQSVSIFGNLLGNSVEGSLVGIARNAPVGSSEGYVSVFGNIGFGSHKSFCHVRGPNALRNISVQNNVSRQTTEKLQTEETRQFAGVAVDVKRGRNLSIKNNELYGYSGHGVHVDSEMTDVIIQHNGIFSAGLAGVRLVDVAHGLVDGNLVTGTEKAGIRLKRTENVVARGNYVRQAGTVGIASGDANAPTGNEIADNYVAGGGRRTDGRAYPAIAVRDSGVRVRGNAIRENPGPAIFEAENVTDNVYEDNWADGEETWRFASSTSRTRNNVPPTDAHRGASAGENGRVVRVEFDRPYARRPRLAFGRVGGGIRNVSYETDDGDFVAAEITVRREGATIDAFVNEG